MDYTLFKDFETFEDDASRTCGCFIYKGNYFIIEPNFYTQLKALEENLNDDFILVFNKLLDTVSKNKKVIFTGDFEFPCVYKDDYIYREFSDLCNPLGIFLENKSRGSDYGD